MQKRFLNLNRKTLRHAPTVSRAGTVTRDNVSLRLAQVESQVHYIGIHWKYYEVVSVERCSNDARPYESTVDVLVIPYFMGPTVSMDFYPTSMEHDIVMPVFNSRSRMKVGGISVTYS